jgi:hypothetical protein
MGMPGRPKIVQVGDGDAGETEDRVDAVELQGIEHQVEAVGLRMDRFGSGGLLTGRWRVVENAGHVSPSGIPGGNQWRATTIIRGPRFLR